MAIAIPRCGRTTGLLGLLAVAAQTGCAGTGLFASTTPLDREFLVAAITWDLNKDGDVTCEEWKQYAAGLLRDADANRDGVLTGEEFAAMARQDRLFEMAGLAYFDADKDGRITLAELIDKPNPAFTLLDTNNDCVITPEERRLGGRKPPAGSQKAPDIQKPPDIKMPPSGRRPGM